MKPIVCRTPWIASRVANGYGDGKFQVHDDGGAKVFVALVERGHEMSAQEFESELPDVRMPGHDRGVVWDWPIDIMILASKQDRSVLACALGGRLRYRENDPPSAGQFLAAMTVAKHELDDVDGHGGHAGYMVHYWAELAREEPHPCRRRALFSKARVWLHTGQGEY